MTTATVTGLVESVLQAIFGVKVEPAPAWRDGDQADEPNAEDSDGVPYAVTPQFSDVPITLTLDDVVVTIPKAAAAWTSHVETVRAGAAQRIVMANPLRRRVTITNYGATDGSGAWIAIGVDESTVYRFAGNVGGYIVQGNANANLIGTVTFETTADVFAVTDPNAATPVAVVGVLEVLDQGGTLP